MNKIAATTRILFVIIATVMALGATRANAGNGTPINDGSANETTLAVFGDWPYSLDLLNNAPLLLDSINSDPKVRLVLHIGDIHSGSMPCTGVGLNPRPAGSNPDWNQGIFNIFEQFKDPLVYTPGDNEWTDCHKSKEFSSGDPLKELASVRDLFFPEPGYTLGERKKRVLSEAENYDPHFPADAQFVENVMWEESEVLFVTINLPGSNNDTVPWSGAFANPAAQAKEVAERSAADLRWLDRAFAQAEANNARAVLIGLQADMWDPAQIVPGGDGLDKYKPFVQKIADFSTRFGRPVLLINGDSHLFEADHPLADPTSATGKIHGTQAVPNLTRITVQGSTNTPSEWLRLTINPRSADVFSWENVVYLP
jgi:hypothetical protein